jgi:non-specific serine/threonine protein kinase
MLNCGNLGLAALLTGDADTAINAFREELALCREMVVRPVAYEGLRGLAAVAVVEGDDERAATLVGAADAHSYDSPEEVVQARLDERFFAPGRARCGTRAWDAAAGDGGRLSFDEAIAYALEEPADAQADRNTAHARPTTHSPTEPPGVSTHDLSHPAAPGVRSARAGAAKR